MRIGSIEGALHHLDMEWRASSYRGKIVVVNLQDLSEIHLRKLLKRGVKAVVNGKTSMTGNFDHRGVERLLEAGIPIFDLQGEKDLSKLHQGRKARISKQRLYMRDGAGHWTFVTPLKGYDPDRLERLKQRAASLRADLFRDFYHRTWREAETLLDKFSTLMTEAAATAIGNQPLLIVAPTSNDEQALLYTKRYFKKIKPFIIALDTSSRMVRNLGFHPDVILGDFTRMHEEDLLVSSLLVVPDTPADKYQASTEHLQKLELPYAVCDGLVGFEETALLYARSVSHGTIFMLGGATSMEEAMTQGRTNVGVQSLMHLWLGSDIVDVKGVSKLLETPANNPQRLEWLGRQQELLDGFKN
ncbi:putative cytokinetic ring protein SteA [Natribacillus halophilus]|uniref:Uncharacterized membrane-anchored protein n=1 Tax=Natribacillus halophilus TaxID=549003 RepID=A0A1G8JIW2_9BACI|nr:putative cytokinetic ring protein SteA [Natribacillus halophilus]SDI31204.1 Uncharacterized membrane-anchored protein [Natribacillus halophilus]